MNLLVTGGAGFIGSNFISYFLKKNTKDTVICLDKLTYAGSLKNLEDVADKPRFQFLKEDICNYRLIKSLFKKYRFQSVIHFAAESHVDNSIKEPQTFVETNINGTFNLLEAARLTWLEAPQKVKKEFSRARFHHISTDEVYGSLGKKGYFTEKTPYAPNSPYSASKASSDFLVRSYFHTYGLNVVTTNCSNNYGPRQHHEKLIPTIIRTAINGKEIPIYGEGKNVRDWLYVADHCEAILKAYDNGKTGETYNIGGDSERTNLQIARAICQILDVIYPKSDSSYKDQITFVTDRPGHDFRYAIDASKIKSELGWQAKESFESGLKKTVLWHLKNVHGLLRIYEQNH